MSAGAFASIDLLAPDPIPEILASQEFQRAVQKFAKSPSVENALVSPDAQALLYCLIKLLGPENAIEIGTYRASTTEAMARAISENGAGRLHTVDPFGADVVPKIISRWPRQLQKITKFHAVDSMMFFAGMQKEGTRSDLVFIDGNHEFEFALFDIQCAARLMNAGGFIMIDNIAQPGPFFAAQDFMETAFEQGWRECGGSLERFRPTEPFDRHRTTIHNTDLCVLRAPRFVSVSHRPATFGELPWTDHSTSLSVTPAGDAVGRIHAQFIIRIFENPPREIIESKSVVVAQDKELDIVIPFPQSSDKKARRTVEAWLRWEGSGALPLRDFPSIR